MVRWPGKIKPGSVTNEIVHHMDWLPMFAAIAGKSDIKADTLQWSGFMHVDTGWLLQDETSKVAIGSVDSRSGLRRVRLRVDGNVWDHAAYAIDLDFAAAGHPSFRDAKLIFHPRLGSQATHAQWRSRREPEYHTPSILPRS